MQSNNQEKHSKSIKWWAIRPGIWLSLSKTPTMSSSEHIPYFIWICALGCWILSILTRAEHLNRSNSVAWCCHHHCSGSLWVASCLPQTTISFQNYPQGYYLALILTISNRKCESKKKMFLFADFLYNCIYFWYHSTSELWWLWVICDGIITWYSYSDQSEDISWKNRPAPRQCSFSEQETRTVHGLILDSACIW